MTDLTGEFFDRLGRRGNVPRLRKTTGTVHFDIAEGDRNRHWLLSIDKGDVRVSQENRGADAVIHVESAVFARITTGEDRLLTAWLRGDLVIEGQYRFLVLLKRLFPGPPGSRHPRDAARTTAGRS